MLFKYGIIAVKYVPGEEMADIVHFCAYEKPPNQKDFDLLRQELETDESLGLVGKMDDIHLVEASEALVEYILSETDSSDCRIDFDPPEANDG